MADLDPRQQRRLAAVLRNQWRLNALGAALALLGSAYAVFGFAQFELGRNPAGAFDRPIAELGSTLGGYKGGLDRLQASTELEVFLIKQLRFQTDVTASVMVLLLRVYMGTLALLAGLILLTVSIERGRLLALIQRLRE